MTPQELDMEDEDIIEVIQEQARLVDAFYCVLRRPRLAPEMLRRPIKVLDRGVLLEHALEAASECDCRALAPAEVRDLCFAKSGKGQAFARCLLAQRLTWTHRICAPQIGGSC